MQERTEREQILDEIKDVEFGYAFDWVRKNKEVLKQNYSEDVEVVIDLLKKWAGLEGIDLLKECFSQEIFNNKSLYITLMEEKDARAKRTGLRNAIKLMGDDLKKSKPLTLFMASDALIGDRFEFSAFISKELLADINYASILVECAPKSIRYINDSLRKNPKFVAKHISENSELLTNQYCCQAFDVETLKEAERLLTLKYDMNDELSNQIAFAIETIQAEEEKKQQQNKQEKNQSTTFNGYGKVEPVTPTRGGGRNNPRRPDVHVAMKTHDGRTIIRTM
ncbi:MAG: hypothetical protein IJA72_00640 [Clostridia bacterium]|nr:hypothetical protein [Clostridia bacterium]